MIENFIIHRDYGKDQHTEADILGVRFPFRSELFENPMQDDEIFLNDKCIPLIFIAEVKSKTCRFNETLTSPEKGNIQRA